MQSSLILIARRGRAYAGARCADWTTGCHRAVAAILLGVLT
jgi:hypothetical protein